MFVSSIFIIQWYNQDLRKGLDVDPPLSDEQLNLRIFSNFAENIEWPFQYLFALNVICLIFRITVMLQFSESIGPLVKIVSKMFDDFINFLVLYFLLAIMFTTIANLNFIYTLV